jgi:phage baseplate assembly protein W
MSVGAAFLGQGWAFPVRVEGEDAALSAEERDVQEAIGIILATNRGERAMRPDFGADLAAFVFEPMNTTTMALVRHRVEQALVQWEPRITVQRVAVERGDPEPGLLRIGIDYVVRRTNTFYNLVYPFYLLEGDPS